MGDYFKVDKIDSLVRDMMSCPDDYGFYSAKDAIFTAYFIWNVNERHPHLGYRIGHDSNGASSYVASSFWYTSRYLKTFCKKHRDEIDRAIEYAEEPDLPSVFWYLFD